MPLANAWRKQKTMVPCFSSIDKLYRVCPGRTGIWVLWQLNIRPSPHFPAASMAATSRHRSGFATKPIFPLHLSQKQKTSAEVMTRIVAAVAAYFRISTRSEIGEGGPRPISGWHKWPSGWQQYRLGSAQNSMHQRNQPIKMPPVSMSQFQPVIEKRVFF